MGLHVAFPLTFSQYSRTSLHSRIAASTTFTTLQTLQHMGVAFLRHPTLTLGSAMRRAVSVARWPTVTHQNGFGSTIAVGVLTFVSH